MSQAQAHGGSVAQFSAPSDAARAQALAEEATRGAENAQAQQRADEVWKSSASMPAAAWIEIASTYEDVMRSIEIAFSERPRSSIAAAMPRAANALPDLEGLRAALDQRLDLLQMRLGETIGGPIAEACVKPLSYFFNEQVERRLTAIAGHGDAFPDWPQPEDTDLGGEAFYTDVAALLATNTRWISPMVVGAYAFCLRAGFKGRYWDNQKAIETLCSDLENKLKPEARDPGLTPETVTRARPVAQMLAVAGVLLVGYQIVLLAIGRVM